MIFGEALETSGEIGTVLRPQLDQVKRLVNEALKHLDLNIKFDVWGVIFVCASDEFIDFFDETIVNRRKTNEMEFRLQLPYEEFVATSQKRQYELIFNILKKSIQLMSQKKLNVDADDQQKLLNMVEQISAEFLKNIDCPIVPST